MDQKSKSLLAMKNGEEATEQDEADERPVLNAIDAFPFDGYAEPVKEENQDDGGEERQEREDEDVAVEQNVGEYLQRFVYHVNSPL